MNFEQILFQLIYEDPRRMQALLALQELQLDNALIAAGFVRNMIWDYQHQQTTPLNDIDVIHLDKENTQPELDLVLENRLRNIAPELPWSVKNQARMHIRNGDSAYKDLTDAMAHWPEKQTAIGVRLESNQQLTIVCPFGLAAQFNLKVEHNPRRSVDIFKQRADQKQWQRTWPKLTVNL